MDRNAMQADTFSWTVAAGAAGMRLDRFIATQLPEESRSQIQNWIRGGSAVVGDKAVKTGYCTKAGDAVALTIPRTPPPEPFPEEIPLDVLYEDDDLAVIHKPAGMACHAGAGLRAGTLVNALLHRMGPMEAGAPERPGIVHRLDKLTSGVILTAKNNFAHRHLSGQFKAREIKKEYIALVYGVPSPPSGTIDLGIGRDPVNRKKMSIRARHKRSAVTYYAVRQDFGFAALLDIRIDTGRTHQIRVHLSAKGHPIIGDPLYGGKSVKNLPDAVATVAGALHRPFLHAYRIEFHHPRSGARLSFFAPLPAELENFLAAVSR